MAVSSSVIKVVVAGDAHSIAGAFKTVRDESDKTHKGFQRMQDVAKAAFFGMASAAVVAGRQMVKWAEDDEAAHAALTVALKNSGLATKESTEAVEKAEKAGEKLNFTHAETQQALTQGITSTHNMAKTTMLLNVAMDLSRFKHISLSAAMLAVTKASQGQLKPLKQIGLDLPIIASSAAKVETAQNKVAVAVANLSAANSMLALTDKEKITKAQAVEKANKALQKAQENLTLAETAGDKVVKVVAATLKGQALAAANTTAGKMEHLKVVAEDWGATLGTKLLPWIDKMITMLTTAVSWLTQHKAIMVATVTVIGAVVTALALYSVVQKAITIGTKLWTVATNAAKVAQFAFNLVMDANPIMLVVIALAAVVAAIVYAYNHFKWFHNLIQTIWDWIKHNWPLLAAIILGPFAIAALLIFQHWNQILGFFKAIPGWVGGFLNNVGSIIAGPFESGWGQINKVWQGAVKFFKDLPGNIIGFFANIYGDMKKIGSGLVQGLIDGIKSLAGIVGSTLKGIFDHLPGVSLLKKVPGMSWLASGGIARAGQGYIVGENGPEYFQPHSTGSVLPHGVMPSSSHGSAMGGGGMTVINMPAGIDPAAVVRAQAKYDRRNGRT